MNRRSMLIPVAVLAATVAASPSTASADGNGWSCISPFANYTNATYPDDPPAPSQIIDSLAISVTRADSTPLTAVPGQPLALRDLQLTAVFTDTRPVEQMYRRTGGITVAYSGIPRGQVENNSRTFSQRANPADGNILYWAYNTAAQNQPAVYVYTTKVASGPPQVRTAAQAVNTPDFTYPAPTVGLAHRFLSRTGNSQFPLDAWVSVAASNTVEGFQTLPVKGYWTVNIQDATPGTPANPANYTNDAVVATVEPVVLSLPRTNWTPTGAGPVEFTIAPRGHMGIVQVESKGYDRVGYNTPLNIRPFGSVYVRAQTEAYGASNDCIPGAISIADSTVAAGQAGLLFGDVDPVNPDPAVGDPATPGAYTTSAGVQKAIGTRGRFGFAQAPLPAIAVAALPPAAVPIAQPAPKPKPVALATGSTAKPSSSGAVTLKLTNPNTTDAKYKLSVKTVSKYKVGKTKKVVTVSSSKTITVKPGAANVKFTLSKTAKTLLKSRKTLKVKVTLTPVAGGSAVTKTITLKRS
jgi:hypothetical protein